MTKACAVALILLAACVPLFAAEESLEQLKARAPTARIEEQPKIYVRIAELELKNVDSTLGQGDIQKEQAAMQDLATACENAAKTSVTTRKHMKQTEIALRKVSERVEQFRKSVEFESRPPIKAAIDRIEQARSDLLNAMFKK
jgi:hypothetical protein